MPSTRVMLSACALACACGSSPQVGPAETGRKLEPASDVEARALSLEEMAERRRPEDARALIAALRDYRPGAGGPEPSDNAMIAVVRAVADMKLTDARPHLLAIFERLRASTLIGQNRRFYRVLYDAMLALVDTGWESALLRRLDAPILSLHPQHQAEVIDQVYWQVTAARLLGEMRSPRAAAPLIRVMLSPLKVSVHTTAMMALIKIGKPAVERATRLSDGEDAELMSYAEAEYLRATRDRGEPVSGAVLQLAKDAYLPSAALVLANIGRRDGVAPMLRALQRGTPSTKVLVASELHKLPASAEITAAFKNAWETTDTALETPLGNAKELLTASVDRWYDPELARWTAQRALALPADVLHPKEAALALMIKLGLPRDRSLVDKLANLPLRTPQPSTLGAGYEKELALTRDGIARCGDDRACWKQQMTAPDNQTGRRQLIAIKAVYMVAAGGPAARRELSDAMPRIANPAVRFAAAAAIDRLSPEGDPEIAAALQALVDDAVARGDEDEVRRHEALETVIYRLQGRAR